MQIAVIRHAVAESRERFSRTNKSDRERPLTAGGRAKMVQAAKGLASWLERFDLLATSPLLRAHQTADIVSEAYGGSEPVLWPELEPNGDPARVVIRLRALPASARVALVSHQPLASKLVAWLLTGAERPFVEFKKGAVCLLDLPSRPGPGRARLLALLPPAVLRKARR